MAIQFSVAVRDARLDAIENTVGASPTLKIWTGAIPANCAAADAGTLLDTMTLPADWMSNAASGSKALSGSWTSAAAAAGTAGYFRIYDGSGVCHIQGTITASGGGGDMIASSVTLAIGDTETVTQFTLADANA